MMDIILIVLFIAIFLFLSFFLNYLFDKYNIRKKYFEITAKNKFIYYTVKISLSLIVVVLGILTIIIDKVYLYIIFLIYVCLYLTLYKRSTIADWKKVKSRYIDNADL